MAQRDGGDRDEDAATGAATDTGDGTGGTLGTGSGDAAGAVTDTGDGTGGTLGGGGGDTAGGAGGSDEVAEGMSEAGRNPAGPSEG